MSSSSRPLLWRKALVASSVVLFVLSAVFAFLVWEMVYYQQVLGKEIRTDLEFDHGSPYVQCGERSREVFTLHPVKGGVMEEAGVHDGEIVTSHKITGFYKMIAKSRGERVSVTVVAAGDGSPLEARPGREITFQVPE